MQANDQNDECSVSQLCTKILGFSNLGTKLITGWFGIWYVLNMHIFLMM